MQTATADASKVDCGSKKGLKNGGIAAMFAAQTSQIKQQDGVDKKVCWIIFLFIWRDIDILPFKPLLFIVQCYLICRLILSEDIVNKLLKGIKSVIIKSCARLKLAVVFPRGGSLEEKPKCRWCPVFFMIYLSLIFSTLNTLTSYLGHCFGLGLTFIINQGFLGTLVMTYLGVSDSTVIFSLLELHCVLLNFWHLSDCLICNFLLLLLFDAY